MSTEDAPQINASTDRSTKGDDFRRRVPSSRNSGSGVLAVLSLIVPVVLGGVTVFGVYFLFLEDLLKPPKSPKPSTKTSAPETEASISEKAPVPPPQPTFAQPSASTEGGRSPATERVTMSPETEAVRQAEREVDAENALRLAEKMWATQPSAAKAWYRKVVEKFPNTRAAEQADDWLKRQGDAP